MIRAATCFMQSNRSILLYDYTSRCSFSMSFINFITLQLHLLPFFKALLTSKRLKLTHLLHLRLLRSKTHLLLNRLPKLLLQETFTRTHQFPIFIHMIYTSKGIHLNRCPLSVFWTHLPYDASTNPYNSFVSKYVNFASVQDRLTIIALCWYLKVKYVELSGVQGIRQG